MERGRVTPVIPGHPQSSTVTRRTTPEQATGRSEQVQRNRTDGGSIPPAPPRPKHVSTRCFAMRTKERQIPPSPHRASDQGVCVGDGRGYRTPGRTCWFEHLQVEVGPDLDESRQDGTRTDDRTHPTARVVARHHVDLSPAIPHDGSSRGTGRFCEPEVHAVPLPRRSHRHRPRWERATGQRGRGPKGELYSRTALLRRRSTGRPRAHPRLGP